VQHARLLTRCASCHMAPPSSCYTLSHSFIHSLVTPLSTPHPPSPSLLPPTPPFNISRTFFYFLQASKNIEALYQTFIKSDCTMVEVNPFTETPDGSVVCVDAKVALDPKPYITITCFRSLHLHVSFPSPLQYRLFSLSPPIPSFAIFTTASLPHPCPPLSSPAFASNHTQPK